MFGSIGGPEVLLIFVLALILLGPRKLPEVGRTLGRTLGEFRKATNDFKASLEREVEIEKLEDVAGALRTTGEMTKGVIRETARLATTVGSIRQDASEPTAEAAKGEDPEALGPSERTASPGPPHDAAPVEGS